MSKTLWLLKKYDINNYYEKVKIVNIGLFETEQLAKDYANKVLGLSREAFVWSCDLEEIKYIEGAENDWQYRTCYNHRR